uniref:Female-specific protein 800 n=1 Tax=Schistosoma mansoni TaxID=6183 RepID=F802_SCHMA|nr:RecName: Full=Female-specific protein 800; Short=FS800 [Schistosoma mansoni]AAA29884.1 female-specific 800 protein [Schistosoma mansoni]
MIIIIKIRINIHIIILTIIIIKGTINLRMSIVNQNKIHITKKQGIIMMMMMMMKILKEIKNLFDLDIMVIHIGMIKFNLVEIVQKVAVIQKVHISHYILEQIDMVDEMIIHDFKHVDDPMVIVKICFLTFLM